MSWYPELLPSLPIALRVALSAILIFAFIIILTRLVGKRGVAKMNSFDWIVTVALGSIAAAGIVSPDDFGPVLVASFVLVSLQWCLTKFSLKTKWIENLIKANPTLLMMNGEILQAGQDKTHVTDSEILAAARGAGLASLQQVKAMVLETDGSFSVVPDSAEMPEAFKNYTLRDLSEIDSL